MRSMERMGVIFFFFREWYDRPKWCCSGKTKKTTITYRVLLPKRMAEVALGSGARHDKRLTAPT